MRKCQQYSCTYWMFLKPLLFNGLHICFTAESMTVNPVMTLWVVKPVSCLLYEACQCEKYFYIKGSSNFLNPVWKYLFSSSVNDYGVVLQWRCTVPWNVNLFLCMSHLAAFSWFLVILCRKCILNKQWNILQF